MLNIISIIFFILYAIVSLITIGGWCYATIQDVKLNGIFGDKNTQKG